MNYLEYIVLFASLITSITVIVTFFVEGYKFIRREEKWRDKKDRHDTENYLSILRLIIVTEAIPLSERIVAGDRYISLGGNGAVKAVYEKLLKELKEEIQ